MGDGTAIEWTHRPGTKGETWNPVVGCDIVSPGCTHCYAMRMAARLEKMGVSHYAGTTRPSKAGAVWTGKIVPAPASILLAPLRWKSPRTIFVNSMGDVFHEGVDEALIDIIFAIAALCPQHTFIILTKRSRRMREYANHVLMDQRLGLNRFGIAALAVGLIAPSLAMPPWPLPNVWLGVSAERQQEADERIPDLLATPAAVRFLSAEPLLGQIDLNEVIPNPLIYNAVHGMARLLDWIIVGGESGAGARPMHPAWARQLRDQCAATGVPFFFKQWGRWAPYIPQPGGDLGGDVRAGRVRIVHIGAQTDVEVSQATGGRSTLPGSRYMIDLGKKSAGRLLDGREHLEFPKVAA